MPMSHQNELIYPANVYVPFGSSGCELWHMQLAYREGHGSFPSGSDPARLAGPPTLLLDLDGLPSMLPPAKTRKSI